MTQDAVKAFLYQTLGYGKIEEILRGGKLSTTRIRELLEGTIFGTSKSMHGSGQELPPRIPKIYALEGSRITQNRDGGFDISIPERDYVYLSKDCAGLGLSYIVHTLSFFSAQTRDEIERFVKGFRRRNFPTYNYKMDSERKSFTIQVKDKRDRTFYFRVCGINNRRQKIATTILFDTNGYTVGCLNRLSLTYYSRYLSSRQGKPKINATPQSAPMDTPQDARVDLKYVPVYLDLAGKAGKISPEELAGELQERTSIPYKMNMPCRVGQVLQHERFGIGIVTGIRIGDNTKKVYFPNERRFIPMV